ncbi:MAG: hypothetical protein HDR03_06495 [Lachnospiraceae bacterium]|nr:hypothetical protein [Lachnospiraceae bacterium]
MRRLKKSLMTVCVGMMLLAGVTGCAKTVESSQQTRENSNNVSSQQTHEESDKVSPQQVREDSSNESDDTIAQEKKEDEADDNEAQENGEAEKSEVSGGNPEDTPAQNEIGFQDGTEFLSGKIQSVEEDGMIIAQTTILEDSMVTLVDEKDAKKISIKFIDDTKVERWIIKGGGADIDRKDAAISDLAVGMGVEMEGYYEEEAFVAIRVLIEEYV